MKFRNIIFIVIALLGSACATNYYIISDYEKAVDFTNYQSFQIINAPDGFPVGANPINKQRIDRAIKRELEGLGYTATENPDLLVSWFVKVQTVKDYDWYANYYGRWAYLSYAHVNEYKKGTLVIDVIDRAENQVIWHGKTSDRVYEGMPKVEKKINAAVHSMIKQYEKDARLRRDLATR